MTQHEAFFKLGDRVVVVLNDLSPDWQAQYNGQNGRVYSTEWADDGFGWGYVVYFDQHPERPETYAYEHELQPYRENHEGGLT